jgi:hypothetical protein
MAYNFGSAEQFEKTLHDYYGKRFLYRLFPHNKRFHAIAERIHGEMTPEQFFEAWDHFTNDRLEDDFPTFPRWLRHFVDLPFLQELKVFWYRRRAEYRAQFGVEHPEFIMLSALLQPVFIVFEIWIVCGLFASFVSSDPQVQYIFLSACGVVTGFYMLFAMFNALAVAFFTAPRRSRACTFNARRARQQAQGTK